MLPPLYDLTPFTGQRSNENRVTVIANVEMKPRTKWVGLISFVASLPLVGILMLFIDIWGVLAVPLVMVSVHYFVNARSQTGLKQRNFETLMDKKKSGDNVFYLCGKPVSVGESEFGVIRRTVTAVTPTGSEDQK